MILNEELFEGLEKNSKGKWVNKGEEGTHGEFKTKKAAREQQKAMFAQGYKSKNLKEDVDNINVKDKLEFLSTYPTYSGAYTRPCKVWDLGLTPEQEDKFYYFLEDGGLINFWAENEELSQDIYQEGRMGGHLILDSNVLDPTDFIDGNGYEEFVNDYLSNMYYPDGDDNQYTKYQYQEAKEEVDAIIDNVYDKLIDFDNRVDQLIVNIKNDLDKYEIRDSNTIGESFNNLNEKLSKEDVQKLADKYNIKITFLDTSGERFWIESATDEDKDNFYKEYVKIYKKGSIKEDLDHEYKVFTIKLKDDNGNIYTEEEKIPASVLSANPDLDLKEYLKEYYDDEILEVTSSGYVKTESFEDEHLGGTSEYPFRVNWYTRYIMGKDRTARQLRNTTVEASSADEAIEKVKSENKDIWGYCNAVYLNGLEVHFDKKHTKDYSGGTSIKLEESSVTESFEDEHLGKADITTHDGDVLPETPKEGAESGIAAVINKLIIDEWEAIQGYNDAIVNAELEGYSNIANVLTEIANEENIHVGQLQKALETISPQTDSIKKGEDEAEKQLDASEE